MTPPAFAEICIFEKYYKSDSDKFLILVVTDEVTKDGKTIASNVREIHVDEAEELGDKWDEDTICKKFGLIRRKTILALEAANAVDARTTEAG